MNFQVNFYKLTRTGRISTRSSLESPRASRGAYICICMYIYAHARELSESGSPGARSTARRNHLLSRAQPVSCPDDVGAGLIMSPTRNRNFVRRVPDKSRSRAEPRVRAAGRSMREKEQEQGKEDRSRERGKEEPVISAGTKPRRDYTLSHTVRRAASFQARESSPTVAWPLSTSLSPPPPSGGLRASPVREGLERERAARKHHPNRRPDVLLARLSLSVDLRSRAHRTARCRADA